MNRVVGGTSVPASQVPWHAVIAQIGTEDQLLQDLLIGGGSLVTSKLILTAAHLFWLNSRNGIRCPKNIRDQEKLSGRSCHDLANGCPNGCERKLESDIQVYLGVTNLLDDNLRGLAVEKVIFYPEFDKHSLSNDLTDGHDLAAVRLACSVTPSPTIQPVCLPQPGQGNIQQIMWNL